MISVSIDAVQTGKNISALQKKRGISVSMMQDALGFANKTSIYNWKRGTNVPSSDNLVILSELFNVPIDSILARCNNAPSENDGAFPFGGWECAFPAELPSRNESARRICA